MFCIEAPDHLIRPCTKLINMVTNASPALVTTVNHHHYKSGIIVRLEIPESCGMPQANGMTGEIIFVDDNNFTIDIDTTFFDLP